MPDSLVLLDNIPPVALVSLNRPKARNAINTEMMRQLAVTLEGLDSDDQIRCIIITGDENAFAAGADIKEMADAGAVDMYLRETFDHWDRIRRIRKPLIAAVSGYALGGGCELALMCDLIVASDTAVFGQPEINIGIIPGAGGSQRLTQILGKSLAMELVLTGRHLPAEEALSLGLVNRVVPVDQYLNEAKSLGTEIAEKPPLAVRLAKEAILQAAEGPLEQSLAYERKLFYFLFASEDQKEGMQAFQEKRKPDFKGR